MIELTDQNFEVEVLQSKIPVLVDFSAIWCGPCQMAEPVLEELAKEYEGKIKFAKLNVDEGQSLAQKYGVMSIPTVVIFKEGKEIGRKVGFPGREGYKKVIDSVLSSWLSSVFVESRDFSSLEIYRLAEKLIIDIYRITKSFPKEEIYGITSQLRRAAVSIAINIAEGYGRYHFKDRVLFLYNARGSLLEVKSLILICNRLGFLKEQDKRELLSEVDKLGVKINNFINYLKSKK